MHWIIQIKLGYAKSPDLTGCAGTVVLLTRLLTMHFFNHFFIRERS